MLAVAALVALTAACTPKPTTPDELADYNERNDPYEPLNRKMFAVNDALDRNVLHPAASGYKDVTSAPVRSHVHNLLSNIANPAQFANDVLQGKPRKAGNTFMRFIVNSTVGVAGVFDVATGLGYPDHDNDFGLTLARWGLPSGPYLFLPVLGPSNPRDGVGYGLNSALDPLTWASFGGSATLGTSRLVLGAIDTRARLLDQTDAIDKTALDPYATYRSLYQQYRASAVRSGRADLPGTVPAWFSTPPPAQATTRTPKPDISPALVPPPSISP